MGVKDVKGGAQVVDSRTVDTATEATETEGIRQRKGATCKQGHEDPRNFTLRDILDKGANPNSMSFVDKGQKETLLCMCIKEAMKTDEFDKVELLIERKANVDLASEIGEYPLGIAVSNGHLNCARILLRAGADANKQDLKGVAPLHTAVFKNNPMDVTLLLAHKANPNITDRNGQTPLFFMDSREIGRLMLDHGADPLHLNNQGQSALHLAAHAGLTEPIDFLHEVAPELLHLQDTKFKRTPLHHAAHTGQLAAVELLMDLGADPDARTKNKWTAMDLADKQGHDSLTYYMYCRITGSRKASWSQSIKNPIFLFIFALMATAFFIHWKTTMGFIDDCLHLWVWGD